MGRPSTLDPARDGVATNSSVGLVAPTQPLFSHIGGFRFRSNRNETLSWFLDVPYLLYTSSVGGAEQT
jgi:hypothetical protein